MPESKPQVRIEGGALRGNGKPRIDQPGLPVITVGIAAYNVVQRLPVALESLAAQNYPNLEVLVIDGRSQDGTVELLRSYGDRIDLWISEPDRGVYDAWNKVLALASGEWIAFLGADDEYLPGALAAYAEWIRQHPEADYVSSQVEQRWAGGRRRVFGSAWEWQSFRRYMTVAHVGSLHRRSFLERVGGFDVSFRSAGDYDLLLREGANLRAAYLPQVTAVMPMGGVSDSTCSLQETYRAVRKNRAIGFVPAQWQRSLATAKFYVRRWLCG